MDEPEHDAVTAALCKPSEASTLTFAGMSSFDELRRHPTNQAA